MMFTQSVSFVRNHWVFTLVLVAVVSYGAYTIFFQSGSTTSSVSTPRTARVEKSDLRVLVAGSGQVEADSQVDLKPVVAGDAIEVTTVAVQNDQTVTKGQVIAILDNQDARRDVAKAELDVHQAEIKAKQTAKLYPKLDRDHARQRQLAQDSVKQSEIALQKVRDRLQDYTVRAPFDGIVTGLSVDSGDTISQTGVLASVISKKLHVSITLNEVDAARVTEGNTAELTFVALPNVTISGEISKLDTIGTVTQNVVSYGAEIELDQQPEGLKPGMSVAADIIVAEKTGVLVVPNAALTTDDGKTTVTVIGSGTRARTRGTADTEGSTLAVGEKREVVIGLSDETLTEIVSGLSEGATIEFPSSTTANESSSPNTPSGQGSILNLFRGSGGGTNRSGGFAR
ncbi:MAG: efflux RND transporter periplasmic adaptor subunit [Candidatus Moraniibacteriota bacterium]